MYIIIDGYNLIRHSDSLRQAERLSLEQGRAALLRQLIAYSSGRPHRITVVFDGWAGGSPEEERDRAGAIEVIYSRLGEKADEVIKRLVAAAGEETIVVTSDRQIASFAARCGQGAVEAPLFASRLEGAGLEAEDPTEREEEERLPKGRKKGPARRLSRRERLALSRLRKL